MRAALMPPLRPWLAARPHMGRLISTDGWKSSLGAACCHSFFLSKLPSGRGASKCKLSCAASPPPHELFGSIAAQTPQCFGELYGDALERDFWWTELERTAEQSPDDLRGREHVRWCAEHPCNASEPRDRVPLGIHGDAGQMHGGEKVMVLSWGGLCRKGSTLDTRLLFACIKDSLMVHEGRKTLFAAFKVLAWSFGSLAAGVHPAEDHEGVPFSAGYFPERLALANTPLVQPEGATTKLVGA